MNQSIDAEALVRLLVNAGSDPERLERAIHRALNHPADGRLDLHVLCNELRDNIMQLQNLHHGHMDEYKSIDLMVRSFRNEASAYQRLFVSGVSKINTMLVAVIIMMFITMLIEIFPNWIGNYSGHAITPVAITCSPNDFTPIPSKLSGK